MTKEPAAPEQKRRWWKFRLRTLLIVVVLLGAACAYVGHEAKIAGDRNEIRKRLKTSPQADLCRSYFHVASGKTTFTPEPGISWMRRLFGDHGVAAIECYSIPPEQKEALHSFFPEAVMLDFKTARSEGYITVDEFLADRH